jgi:hypothetical protein
MITGILFNIGINTPHFITALQGGSPAIPCGNLFERYVRSKSLRALLLPHL